MYRFDHVLIPPIPRNHLTMRHGYAFSANGLQCATSLLILWKHPSSRRRLTMLAAITTSCKYLQHQQSRAVSWRWVIQSSKTLRISSRYGFVTHGYAYFGSDTHNLHTGLGIQDFPHTWLLDFKQSMGFYLHYYDICHRWLRTWGSYSRLLWNCQGTFGWESCSSCLADNCCIQSGEQGMLKWNNKTCTASYCTLMHVALVRCWSLCMHAHMSQRIRDDYTRTLTHTHIEQSIT